MIPSRCLLLLVLALSGFSAWGLDSQEEVDPWETMNRSIFAFNETLDKYVLLPTAKGYRFVMPDPAERGVTNFVLNIYEFNSIINSLLQGRPGNALQSAGRFLVNTTVGLAGFLDVATPMGISHSPADFGQTLYTWGFESGPYLMLPVAGPSTVRGGAGFLFDSFVSVPGLFVDGEWSYPYRALEVIDTRANLIKADDLITGDRYIFVRGAYLQRRAYFLNGGEVEDSFMDYKGEEYEEF